MQMHEIRALTDQQLQEELEKTERELMDLRFRVATNQLPNTNSPRTVRRTIARLKTVANERQQTEA